MSRDDAISLARALRAEGLAYFEQPVRRDDLDGMRAVRHDGGIRTLADESAFNADDVRRLIAADAVDLIAVKLVKAGGLRPGLEAATTALEAGIGCVVIDPLGSAISLTAGADLAAVLPDPGVAHGLSGGLEVDAPHAPHGAVMNGAIAVPCGRRAWSGGVVVRIENRRLHPVDRGQSSNIGSARFAERSQ